MANIGQFTFTGIASGDYTVTINYSGFSTFTQKVTIVSGQSVRLSAAMAIASNTQNVQVYADRKGGELSAINRTLNADNIINVLPADVITSLPNANIADALGRLPSVTLERDEGEGKYVQIRGTESRLTNTTIDGVNVAAPESGVRLVKLDLIPADLVESVQINKTLQANMPGDGIGGSGGGIKGPNGDIYLYSHLQTDLLGSYKLDRGLTAVAYGTEPEQRSVRLLPGEHAVSDPARVLQADGRGRIRSVTSRAVRARKVKHGRFIRRPCCFGRTCRSKIGSGFPWV